MKYPAGNYATSINPGTGTFDLVGAGHGNRTELYAGYWLKYSSVASVGQFWNPIAIKFEEYDLGRDSDPGSSRANLQATFRCAGGCANVTNQLNWAETFGGGNQKNWACNLTNFSFGGNQWFWVETHIRLGTPGGQDSVWEIWFNNVQCARYTNVAIPAPAGAGGTYGLMQWAAVGEWGGGGGTITKDQFAWRDHIMFCTTQAECAMPGSTPPRPDTTAPMVPSEFTVQ